MVHVVPQDGRGSLERVAVAIIASMASDGKVNLASVARGASVSRSYLYQNAEARRLVDQARQGGMQGVQTAASREVLALRTRCENAEQRCEDLRKELAEQRQVWKGVVSSEGSRAENAREMVHSLQEEHRELRKLLREKSESTETLEKQLVAARDTVRFLDHRLADLEIELLKLRVDGS